MKRLPLAITVLTALIVILFLPVLRSPAKGVGNFGDIYLHYYPLKHLVAEQLITGKMPLWNPYIFAGEPLMANPQSAVAYPFSMIFDIFPLSLGFTLFFMIHLLLGGIGMYLLLAEARLSATACLLGAISYGCSSFLVSKIAAGHPVALSGYIWLPFVVLGFLRTSAHTISDLTAEAFLFVLSVSFQFLSGHTFPVYISLVVLMILFVRYKRLLYKEVLVLGGAIVVLCSFQLFQTLELSRLAETENWVQLARQYSWSIKDFVTVIMPNYFGNSIDGTYISADHPSYYFEKNIFYFGSIPFLLSMMGLYDNVRRRSWLLPVIVVSGVFLGLGFHNGVYRLLYTVVPAMDLLRVPARFVYISVFALIVLAAYAWQRWFKHTDPWFKGLLLVLVIVDLVSANAKYIYPGQFERYQQKNERLSAIDPLHRIITDPDSIAANKSMLYHHYNLNGYEAIFLEDFVRYMGLQEKGIFSATGLARTNLSSPLVRGFAAATVVSRSNDDVLLTPLPEPLTRIFVARNLVSSVGMDVYEQIDWLRTTAQSPDQELLVSSLPHGFPLSSASVSIYSYRCEPSRIMVQVRCDGPAALVFSEVAYPGWQAVAGRVPLDLVRGNKIFRTILKSILKRVQTGFK
ncbi:MAG: hypothetical protein ABSH12_09750 [Endomicrobiales bacterium]